MEAYSDGRQRAGAAPHRLLLCGFTSFPGAPVNPAGLVVETIRRSGWRPDGAELDYVMASVEWAGAVEPILLHLQERPASGVLVVGVATSATGFRVETLGRNQASSTSVDAAGAVWTTDAISADGPATLRVTAPVDAMVDAVRRAGLPCVASDDAGDYLCNFSLYRLLEALPGIPVGFLHIPQAQEIDPKSELSMEALTRAVEAAARAFSRAIGAEKVSPARDV